MWARGWMLLLDGSDKWLLRAAMKNSCKFEAAPQCSVWKARACALAGLPGPGAQK